MKDCSCCGKAFKPKRWWQIYCSKTCRLRQWEKDNPRVYKRKRTIKKREVWTDGKTKNKRIH